MSISTASLIDELVARLQLSQGSPTLLLLVAGEAPQSPARLGEVLTVLLSQASLTVHVLPTGTEAGPLRWVQATHGVAAHAYLAVLAPEGGLLEATVARELNAQRQHLQDLKGPLLLLVPARMELRLRQDAPDFHTWRAATYTLPPLEQLKELARARGALRAPTPESRPVASQPPLRFLHLSDLHLRPGNVRAYDQERVLNGLLAYLERERERAPLDVIFLTGDVAYSGSAEEYTHAAGFLRRLLEVTGVTPDRFFVVPGNHDVERSQGRWLLRTLGSDEDASQFFVEEGNRRWHAQKFSAYHKAMSELFGTERGHGLRCGEKAVEVIDIRGVRVAVAAFNSAWFAQDDEDASKLWLGEANVDLAGQHIRRQKGVALSVALMHHPIEALAEQERDNVEMHLERNFDLLLRGHLHKDKIRGIHSARGGYLEIAAPSAYQGSKWPNGCVLGEFHADGRDVVLTPLKFGNGADPWVLDTTVFPDDTEHGYRHTFKLSSPRETEEAALVRSLKPELEQMYEQLGPERRKQIQNELGSNWLHVSDLHFSEARGSFGEALELWRGLRRDSRRSVLLVPSSPHAAERLSGLVSAPEHPIVLDSEKAFDELLEGLVDFWKAQGATWLEALNTFTEDAYTLIVGAYLSRAVQGQVGFGVAGPSGRADILVSSDAELPSRRAVIEVKKGSLFNDRSQDWAASDRLRVDHHAAHMAFIIFQPRKAWQGKRERYLSKEGPVHVLYLASLGGGQGPLQAWLTRLSQLKDRLGLVAKLWKGLRITSATLKPDVALGSGTSPEFDVHVEGLCPALWQLRLFMADAEHPFGELLREDEDYVRQGAKWTFDSWRLQGHDAEVLVIAFAAPSLPPTQSLLELMAEAPAIPDLQVTETLLTPSSAGKP